MKLAFFTNCTLGTYSFIIAKESHKINYKMQFLC